MNHPSRRRRRVLRLFFVVLGLGHLVDNEEVPASSEPMIDGAALAKADSVAAIIAATKIPPTTNLVRSFH